MAAEIRMAVHLNTLYTMSADTVLHHLDAGVKPEGKIKSRTAVAVQAFSQFSWVTVCRWHERHYSNYSFIGMGLYVPISDVKDLLNEDILAFPTFQCSIRADSH